MNSKIGKAIITLAIVVAVLAWAGSSWSASIVLSKHDFSDSNRSGSTGFAGKFYVDSGGFPLYIDEVCVFCHTPHSASTNPDTKFLWNRISSPPATYSYQMYSSPSFSVTETAPTGVSMMCMSCHDGVTSLAANVNNNPLTPTLLNAPGRGNPQVFVDTAMIGAPGAIGNAYSGAPPLGWGANLGDVTPSGGGKVVNLSNDHPISFVYPTGMPGIKTPTDPGLRVNFGPTGDRMECATCHRVHDPAIPPFLSMDNAQSLMCRNCHDK